MKARQQADSCESDIVALRSRQPTDPPINVHPLALTAIRLGAWFVVSALVVLTVVPPSMRPVSTFPSAVEHLGSFFLAGLLYRLGYPRRLFVSLAIAVAFAAAIELLQIPIPGRHARLIDFAVDAVAGCAGTLIGFLFCSPAHGTVEQSQSPKNPRES